MRKRGNISVVLLTSLVVLLAGSAIIAMSVNSKFAEKQSYERIANRYTSESGVDMAIRAILVYISFCFFERLADMSFQKV